MEQLFTLQCSLLLEYCSKLNLRSYLIDHETEFKKSLEYFENNRCLDPLATPHGGVTANDLIWLYRWTYQVILQNGGVEDFETQT